ncbi:MAG: transporter substrate-binding domain-containing protein [Roseinatronobacter sp.]
MTANWFWVAYFVIGLVIVIAAARRQFDEPSWLSDDQRSIRGLPPADIVEPRRYRNARVLYISVVTLVFVVLCVFQPALQVVITVLELFQSMAITATGPTGGAVPLVIGDDEAGASVFSEAQSMQTRSEFPILISLAMVAAMRIPLVQRVEQALRSFAHGRYGIPTSSETLHRRLSMAAIDLDSLDAALQADPNSEPVGAAIRAHVEAAHEILGSGVSRPAMADQLTKIIAYRIWLRDHRVWPAADVFPAAPTLARWHERVLDEINAVEQDLALLSDDEIRWTDAEVSADKAAAMRRIRRERWERCVAEIRRLCGEVCSLIVLIDQRSALPDASQPTAGPLRALLHDLHRDDADTSPLVDRMLVLVLLVPVISGLAGIYRALGWQRIAAELGITDPVGRSFDPGAMGLEFAISGLTIYGTAALVGGLVLGRSQARQTHRRGRGPVLPGLIGVFVVCFLAVALAYGMQLTLVHAIRLGWDASNIVLWLRGIESSTGWFWVAQAGMGGMFGLFVALITIARLEEWHKTARLGVSVAFVAVMALAGLVLAVYFVGYQHPSTLRLHMQLYPVLTAVLALVAVLLLGLGRRASAAQAEALPLAAGHGAAALAALLVLSPQPLASETSVLRIGMRVDAKPFAWRNTEAEPFQGFLVDLCREAVVRTGQNYEEVPISARDRFDPDLALDLVCDPTTITRARAARHDFTPLIFIANGGFVTNPSARPLSPEARSAADCAEPDADNAIGAGLLEGTTAVAAFARAQSDRGVLPVAPDSTLCRIGVHSHADGIARLCAGELRHYFGDIDILRAYVEDHQGCTAELHPTFRTYEPYALILSAPDAEFRRAFVAALYGLFADGTVMHAYEANFGTARPPSEALDMLFRMLRIPAGQ